MTEGRATGVPKIIHAMQANGSPPPEFDFDDDRIYFRCRLPVHPQAAMPKALAGSKPTKGAPAAGVESRVESGVESGVGTVADKVITLLAEGPRLKSEIARGLLKSRVTGQVHRLVARLLAAGMVERTIPDKPNSRLQKYRLTDKGRSRVAPAKP